MTDEGVMGAPLDAVEVANAMRNMAAATWVFYGELKEQGFEAGEAMRLTVAWLVGTAGGKAA